MLDGPWVRLQVYVLLQAFYVRCQMYEVRWGTEDGLRKVGRVRFTASFLCTMLDVRSTMGSGGWLT
jgi:hypothetical protein